jgi:hypothetical protein
MFDASRTVHAIFDYLAKWLPEEPAALKRLDDIADIADIADSEEEDMNPVGSVEQGPISSVPVSGIHETASGAKARTRAAS